MDDLVCPRCKTTKYRNPSLKLMVNVCGHALCDSCVELLFVKGSGACPACGVALRRSGFRIQLFEDPMVEKEVDIRRRVLKDFNKSEADFATLREYNDYLEQVETVVFNLVNNLNVVETAKLIEQYKKDNKEQIAKSKARPRQEILDLEAIIEEENMLSEMRRQEIATSERDEKLRKLKNREALIDDLMFSDSDADYIITSHKETVAKQSLATAKAAEVNDGSNAPPVHNAAVQSKFTSGVRIGTGAPSGFSFLPVPKVEEVPLFAYEPLRLDLGGLEPPSQQELTTGKLSYLANVKAATVSEKAGGFHSSIACLRALQDAFADISFNPKLLGIRSDVSMDLS